MTWIVIEKMFTNQSFTVNKAVIDVEMVRISQQRFTISKTPSVTRCSI